MVQPRCPNCKRLYRVVPSDDPEYDYMIFHNKQSTTCPYNFVGYHDLPDRLIEQTREFFKREFPYKYKDAKKALS